MLENPDGTSGFTQVGDDVGPGIESIELPIPLFARVNARYILQSCNSGGCTDSDMLTVPATLNDAVGVLRADTPEMLEKFGAGASFSDDGNTLAIGTRANSADGDAILYDAGSVYIFTKEADGSWLQRATFESSQPVAAGLFGETLSLDADGDTLVVGAQSESAGAHTAGAVYVYSRQPDNTWTEQQRIVPESPESGAGFGISVAVADDGNTIAIGSNQKDVQGKAGEAFVFTRDTGGTWTQQAYIKSSKTGSPDRFGRYVSLDSDGDTLAVGAPQESSDNAGINPIDDSDNGYRSGAAYVFKRSADGTWTQQVMLKSLNPESPNFPSGATSVTAGFGGSLSLTADGASLAIGATGESPDSLGDDFSAGTVYLF